MLMMNEQMEQINRSMAMLTDKEKIAFLLACLRVSYETGNRAEQVLDQIQEALETHDE